MSDGLSGVGRGNRIQTGEHAQHVKKKQRYQEVGSDFNNSARKSSQLSSSGLSRRKHEGTLENRSEGPITKPTILGKLFRTPTAKRSAEAFGYSEAARAHISGKQLSRTNLSVFDDSSTSEVGVRTIEENSTPNESPKLHGRVTLWKHPPENLENVVNENLRGG